MAEADDAPDPTRCKVGRLLEAYDLDGLGAELERRWTARGDERESLRSLAELVDRRVVESALRSAGRAPTAVEVEGIYEALSGDDDSATRTRTRRDLERSGVDVDELRDAFVTHQAVHTYLTDYRGASYEPPPTTVADEQSTLARLRSRTSAVTASAVERLVSNGDLADREYEPLVSVQVVCRDCGRSHEVDDHLESGGCHCSAGDDPGSRADDGPSGASDHD